MICNFFSDYQFRSDWCDATKKTMLDCMRKALDDARIDIGGLEDQVKKALHEAFESFEIEGRWQLSYDATTIEWVSGSDGTFWSEEFPVDIALTPESFVRAIEGFADFDLSYEHIARQIPVWRDAIDQAQAAITRMQETVETTNLGDDVS